MIGATGFEGAALQRTFTVCFDGYRYVRKISIQLSCSENKRPRREKSRNSRKMRKNVKKKFFVCDCSGLLLRDPTAIPA